MIRARSYVLLLSLEVFCIFFVRFSFIYEYILFGILNYDKILKNETYIINLVIILIIFFYSSR